MNKVNRWLRSTQGLLTIAGLVCALFAFTAVGQAAGWIDISSLFGAAGLVPTNPEFPAPAGGYTCLPTCAENDGKFLTLVGDNMKSLGGIKIITWIAVPGSAASLKISIFDGDSGEDSIGALNPKAGNWDTTQTETTYTLYADPLKDGSGMQVIGVWHGNQDPMPNNDWYDITINKAEAAKGPSGHYFYRLEAERPVEGSGINAFKLRSTGYLAAGKSLLNTNPLGIVGMLGAVNDLRILYPSLVDINNLGPSSYTGDWVFSIDVFSTRDDLEIWDGDFDRGTSAAVSEDTDDPNTVGKPGFANAFAVDEGIGGKGAPADNSIGIIERRDPAVVYDLIDPSGANVYQNTEPSGTEEWESFLLSSKPENNPDGLVDRIEPGFWVLHIQGLDLFNSVWLSTEFEICDPENGCGPPVWEGGGCALPLSYWNKNFTKLYKGKGSAAQETRASIEWGLRNTALASLLFRSGINPAKPVIITNPVPMNPDEAMKILLQDKGKGGPKGGPKGGLKGGLDSALRNVLAAWLNLGTGKMSPNTPAYLDVHGGYFEGTVLQALQEAENIILNGGDLQRAQELGEFLGYGGTYEEKPAPPAPPAPAPVLPPPAPDPSTCGARVNDYTVENPTTNPFYGVRYQFGAGTPIVNGDYDEFKLVLPRDVAGGLTSVQMAAEIVGISGNGTLTGCDFAGPLPCGEPIRDASNNLYFYFMGAADNGDGTLTLIFDVQNQSDQPLQSVTIGLPDGVVPSAPTGTYQSQVCP